MKQFSQFYATLLVLFLVFTASTRAQTERFKAADSEGVTATRDSTTLYLKIDANANGPIKIPRLAAPLRSMRWQGSITEDGISLKPEPDHWVISWKKRLAEDATLVLQFDDEPLLPQECEPIKTSTDGSFYLPAHLAWVKGEKIRYEPQPHKNTVGFWTGQSDMAGWLIHLEKPGRFNVAVLQGCGKGHGGSTANLLFEILSTEETQPDATLGFDVVETGHFQNFKWVHLGEVQLTQTGAMIVGVEPKQIKKAALMDIRAIHLIRLPDKK